MPSNNDRAEWALSSLLKFAELTGLRSDRNHEELDTIVGDFLCNLRHLCSRDGLDFDNLVADSKHTFDVEEGLAEEEEE